MRLLILALAVCFTSGCGHKTRLTPPEPRRVEKVSNISANVICGKIVLEWSPVFFDNRAEPLNNPASYIILRRRGDLTESETDSNTENDTKNSTENSTEKTGNQEKITKLPVEYNFSVIAVEPGTDIALTDPDWMKKRLSLEDPGLTSGPVWSMQNRYFKKNRDFPDHKTDDESVLVQGYNYYYMILAMDAKGATSEPSSIIQIPWINIPGAPENILLETDQNLVTLNWSAPLVDCLGNTIIAPDKFEVYRKDENAPEKDFLLVAKTEETNYEDSAVQIDKVYQYKIRAIQTTKIPGEFSEILIADTTDLFPPETPKELTGAVSMIGVHLNWYKVSDKDIAGYRIYRRENNKGEFTLLNDGNLVSTNTYTDENIVSGTTYEYHVSAVDKSAAENESEPGTTWTVTVK